MNKNSWNAEFDSLLDVFEPRWLWHQDSTSKYPPYNIIKDGNTYTIELALAGFSIEDIAVTLTGNTLNITGKKGQQKTTKDIYRGIASRAFSSSFTLGPAMEVGEAAMENGLLSIKVYYKSPQQNGPKTIPIRGLRIPNQPTEFLSEDR